MQRRNREPHTLDQPVVICKRAVLFCIRGGGKNDVSRRSSLVLKEFLDDEEIESCKRVLASFELPAEETTRHVERANRIAGAVEHFTNRDPLDHHSHVVSANAVVIERQRMEEEPPAFGSKYFWQLRNEC